MKFFKNSAYLLILVLLVPFQFHAQELLTSVHQRDTYSLNGEWQYIVDPYETGYYDYRFKESMKKIPEPTGIVAL